MFGYGFEVGVGVVGVMEMVECFVVIVFDIEVGIGFFVVGWEVVLFDVID